MPSNTLIEGGSNADQSRWIAFSLRVGASRAHAWIEQAFIVRREVVIALQQAEAIGVRTNDGDGLSEG